MEFTEKFKLKYRVRVDCKTQPKPNPAYICFLLWALSSSLEYASSPEITINPRIQLNKFPKTIFILIKLPRAAPTPNICKLIFHFFVMKNAIIKTIIPDKYIEHKCIDKKAIFLKKLNPMIIIRIV